MSSVGCIWCYFAVFQLAHWGEMDGLRYMPVGNNLHTDELLLV
jgi:hypothetical protein